MAEDINTLLALLRRTTDDQGYLQPLLADPDSGAIVGAQIAIMARLGPAVDHNGAQATISDSSGGQPGTSTITVSRTSGATTGTIPKGFGFIDARGVRVVVQVDIVVTAGQLSKLVPVQTLRQTELVNSEDDPAFVVDPQSPIVVASSGVLIAPTGSPGMTGSTFQTIGPSDPITGGAADYLSVHGGERGQLRQTGEQTSDYRQRIRNIPDAVSPIAIGDTVQAAAQQGGLPPLLVVEPFRDGATPALKALHGLSSFDSMAWDTDFYDDPISGIEIVDRRSATAYFAIDAQDFITDSDGLGYYWDDGFYDDPVLGYLESEPVFPPGQLASLLALINDVNAKRLAGVNFDLFLKRDDFVVGQGSTTSAGFVEVVTLSPPGGTIWILDQVLAGADAANPITGAAHHVVYDLEGGGTFQSPDFTQTWTEDVARPTRRVTAVHAFQRSNGSATAHLVVYVRALAMSA